MAEEKIEIFIDDEGAWDAIAPVKKDSIRMLAFSLGPENYCVDIRQVRSVEKIERITNVPNAPDYAIGVINLRGEVITVLDIRYFLDLQEHERTRQARIIVTDVTASPIGIIVDRIIGALDIDEEAIEPPLATLDDKLKEYTRGQIQSGGSILIALDLEKILDCEDIVRLKKGE